MRGGSEVRRYATPLLLSAAVHALILLFVASRPPGKSPPPFRAPIEIEFVAPKPPPPVVVVKEQPPEPAKKAAVKKQVHVVEAPPKVQPEPSPEQPVVVVQNDAAIE